MIGFICVASSLFLIIKGFGKNTNYKFTGLIWASIMEVMLLAIYKELINHQVLPIPPKGHLELIQVIAYIPSVVLLGNAVNQLVVDNRFQTTGILLGIISGYGILMLRL